MAELVFHPLASADFRTALAWYHDRNRRAAQRFERAVMHLVMEIRDTPERFPDAEDGCREAQVTGYPYSVIYRVQPNGTIYLLAVAHASREPGYWTGRT